MIQIDMEMPKSCADCKICRFDFEYDNSFCPFVGDVTQMVDEIPQKCPLKETKQGEWIPVLNQREETIAYRCSECCTSTLLDPRWCYCPFCGVPMGKLQASCEQFKEGEEK